MITLKLFLVDEFLFELQTESGANEEPMRLQRTCLVPNASVQYKRADNKNRHQILFTLLNFNSITLR